MGPFPRVRSLVVGDLTRKLDLGGHWPALAARLPQTWDGIDPSSLPLEGWHEFDEYLELLTAMEQSLGPEAVRVVGFEEPIDSGAGPLAVRTRQLGAAVVNAPRDWLTMPSWLWRTMTREAGRLRKIELGSSHVVFHLSGLPDGIADHSAFQQRIAGMLESVARRGEMHATAQIERESCKPDALRLRLVW